MPAVSDVVRLEIRADLVRPAREHKTERPSGTVAPYSSPMADELQIDEVKRSPERTDLKEHLDAIVSDVIVADKCYFLLKEISDHSDAINEENFGELFGFLQDELLSMYTLTLARLFEHPKRYTIRGIPATLDFLESKKNAIPFDERGLLIRELQVAGMDGVSDADLTTAAIAVMRDRLPNAEGTELFDALDAMRFRRDKTIAHNEVFDPTEMPAVTWGRTQRLLDLAKTIVAAIGGGYFGISFKSYFADGTIEYGLSKDAQRSALALNRLLRRAEVLKKGES
jgi:hypothetical protein